jgi:hypothetical protein
MGRGEQTRWAQRMAILEWLEEPSGENFKLITGRLEVLQMASQWLLDPN